MNVPLIHASPNQIRTAVELADAVAGQGGCVGVVARDGVDTVALLVQMELELSSRRIRCIRVYGPSSGGLAPKDLIAQIVGRPDPGALTDDDLKAAFMALTGSGNGHAAVALLVTEAHNLQPSAARYLQLASRSSPELRIVLVGGPNLAGVLAADEFTPLRRSMRMLELPDPAAGYSSSLFADAPRLPSVPAVSKRNGSWPLVRWGLVASLVLLVGVIAWRHQPASSLATPSAQPGTTGPAATAQEPVVRFVPVPRPEAPETVNPAVEQKPALPAAVPDASAARVPSQPPAAAAVGNAAPADKPPVPATPERTDPVRAAASAPVQAPEPAAAVETPDAASAVDAEAAATSFPKAGAQAAGLLPDAAVAARRTRKETQRAAAPLAALPARLADTRPADARPADDRPGPTDDRRCRDIVFGAQLGKDPSDADKQFLRSGCHAK